jgi:hypothetical protein
MTSGFYMKRIQDVLEIIANCRQFHFHDLSKSACCIASRITLCVCVSLLLINSQKKKFVRPAFSFNFPFMVQKASKWTMCALTKSGTNNSVKKLNICSVLAGHHGKISGRIRSSTLPCNRQERGNHF